jgi:hypothetical protein
MPKWNSGGHFAFMVEHLLSAIMEIPFSVHQQFNGTVSHNAGANWSVIVPATGADVVLCRDQQFCHSLGTQVSRHHEMPDFVSSQVGNLSWTISLVPIGGD